MQQDLFTEKEIKDLGLPWLRMSSDCSSADDALALPRVIRELTDIGSNAVGWIETDSQHVGDGVPQKRESSQSPSDVDESLYSRLSEILEENPSQKYLLSANACRGILERTERRGKLDKLPPMLRQALESMSTTDKKQEKPSHPHHSNRNKQCEWLEDYGSRLL